MGFSGGGSNILKSHTHDGTVTQDGGALNFNNVTQSQSAAGEVFYSDGVHLQQLAYPAVPAGETLTAVAASSAPSWQTSAAVTPAVEKIASTVLPSGGSSITCSFTPVNQTDCAKFYGVLNATKPGASNIFHMYINGITTSTYQYQWQEVEGAGTRTNGYTSGTSELQVVHNWSSLSNVVTFDVILNADTELIQYSTLGMANADYKTCVGINTTSSQTALSEIRFDCDNPSGSMGAGTTLSVYRVNL